MQHHRVEQLAGILHRTGLLLMTTARKTTLSVCMAIGLGVVTACTGAADAGSAPVTASSATASAATVSRPTGASCAGRTVSFGPLLRTVVVTEISDVTKVSSTSGGSFTSELRPVRSVVPAVEVTGSVDATFVFAEFAKQAGPDVAQIGEASPHGEASGQWTVGGAGAMVVFESVRRVEASFTYRCAGAVISGVVRSWGQSRTGILQCDLKKPQTAEVATEVAALAC